jgi:mannose-6-phosphate isomerase
LNYIDVKKHDLFYVPAGTLHALKKGLVVLEIQQSSDTTFRLYDYGRDKNDTTRKLTVNESLENIITPFVKPALETKDNELLTSPFFSIAKIENKGKCSYDFSYAC